MEQKIKNLRTFNIVMGGLHLVQALVLFFIIDYDVKIPIISRFFGIDPVTGEPGQIPEIIWEVPVAIIAPVFLLLSSLAHFIIATIYYRTYSSDLQKGINKARWIEYAISSSIMIAGISMLSGIIEFSAVVSIFALNAIMNLMGLMMEIHNQKTEKTNWLSYNIGVFAGLVPWILAAIYFVAAVNNFSGEAENPIPTYAYIAFFITAFFFNTFAINMFLQYAKTGPWSKYLFGEKVYIVLSLVAKSALAWIIYLGVSGSI